VVRCPDILAQMHTRVKHRSARTRAAVPGRPPRTHSGSKTAVRFVIRTSSFGIFYEWPTFGLDTKREIWYTMALRPSGPVCLCPCAAVLFGDSE
jgi:hypothetical protein